jgi:uncharacterized protein YjlB
MAETHLIRPSGNFPNNPRLPLIVYRKAIEPEPPDPALPFERRFASNGWSARWRDGIFRYHHYHSTAHEVLGIARGSARVQLGGDEGLTTELEAGDVVVIPAGVAHKNLGSSSDLLVVGGYPRDQDYDMRQGDPEEREPAERNVSEVPLPEQDPVEGAAGALHRAWRQAD